MGNSNVDILLEGTATFGDGWRPFTKHMSRDFTEEISSLNDIPDLELHITSYEENLELWISSDSVLFGRIKLIDLMLPFDGCIEGAQKELSALRKMRDHIYDLIDNLSSAADAPQ